MRLSVAANYDTGLIPQLARYPVKEIYGKYPADVVGGGRPSYMARPLSRQALNNYVQTLKEHGIEFNYLFNSSCLGNREWSKGWQKKTDRLLDELSGMGVPWLTVSNPYLLELIRKRHPHFKIKVGIYAQVDTAERARFWEGLGADCITLESFSINRAFERLLDIRRAVSCDLQLIVNHCCLPNCAIQPYHQNQFAHASDGSRGLCLDYCFFTCTLLRLQNPHLFIQAGWIRPEDLKTYEDLGFSSFKLMERNIPSENLLQRVRVYSERSFQGNLAELLLSHAFPKPPPGPRVWNWRFFFRPLDLNPRRLLPLMKLARRQGMLFPRETFPIHIDASKIPSDFLGHIQEQGCGERGCQGCGYCRKVAEEAVNIDSAFQDETVSGLRAVKDSMISGSLWNV